MRTVVSWSTLRNRVYGRLMLIVCLTLLIAFIFFNSYKHPAGSVPRNDYASLQKECNNRIESMSEVNQELSAQIARLQEELRLTEGERESLKQDRAQLLFMVEKLEQQSGTFSSLGKGSSLSKKIVRSWLVRIAELRNAQVQDEAPSRNEYINEVNEVVRGLKEDFTEDVFILGIGYSKTTSSVKRDISAAQKKLDDITKHLSASYSPGVDE